MIGGGALWAIALLSSNAGAMDAPAPVDTVSVAEAEKNIEAWNGRKVSVQGWLSDPCRGLSCAIFSVPVKPGQDWSHVPVLSIAGRTPVEPVLTANQGREVIITGVLNSVCRPAGGMICTDRAPDITPISVVPLRLATEEK